MFNRRKIKKRFDKAELMLHHFDQLPDETMLHLFSFFSAETLCAISPVSSRFYGIASDNQLWESFIEDKLRHAYPNLTSKKLYRLSFLYQFLFEGNENNYLTRLANNETSLTEINNQLKRCLKESVLEDSENYYNMIEMKLAEKNNILVLKPFYVPINRQNAWLGSLWSSRSPYISSDLKYEAKDCSWPNGLCIYENNVILLSQLLEKLGAILSKIKSKHPIIFIATTKNDIDAKRLAINQAKVNVTEMIIIEKGNHIDGIVKHIQNKMSKIKLGVNRLEQLHFSENERHNKRCLLQ